MFKKQFNDLTQLKFENRKIKTYFELKGLDCYKFNIYDRIILKNILEAAEHWRVILPDIIMNDLVNEMHEQYVHIQNIQNLKRKLYNFQLYRYIKQII